MITSKTDVVGSLLRPEFLKIARADLEAGRMQAPEFKRIEDRAVDEAIALQEGCGLGVVTDGEMRRSAFYAHLVESLEGFNSSAGWTITFRDSEGHKAQLERPVVVEKLQWRRQMCAEEFTYLRGRTKVPSKVTLLSAQQAAAYYDPDKSRAAYPTRDAYLADLVDYTRREIAELIRLGCEYVQIDAPQYAGLLDETIREGYRQRGSDPDKMLDATIELDNAIVAGHSGITFGIHICRGNHKSMFYASGGYDRIAEKVFSRAHFDRFLLEYRRRAIGDVRAAAASAGQPDRGAWARQLEDRADGDRREPEGADRRSGANRPARAPRAQPAVRVRVHPRRKRALGDRPEKEAGAGRRGRETGVGVTRVQGPRPRR